MTNRFPSFLVSMLLHLLAAALLLWMPSSTPPAAPERGQIIAGFVTIGAAGKRVPNSIEAIPEAGRGETEIPQAQPDTQTPEASTPPPVEVAKPEVKPEITTTPTPSEDAVPIVKPEEKKPEEKKPEPQTQKPEEKKPTTEKKEEKKTEKPKDDKKDKKKEQKVDIEKELRDLAQKTGTATGSRKGTGSVAQGKGKDHSSPDEALNELAKSLGGSGDDASGRGPGGRGGHGMGRRGTYDQSIISSIRRNWTNPDRIDGKRLAATVKIAIDPDGTIAGAKIMKSSGSSTFDDLVMQAIKATRKLEPPQTPDQHEVLIKFSP